MSIRSLHVAQCSLANRARTAAGPRRDQSFRGIQHHGICCKALVTNCYFLGRLVVTAFFVVARERAPSVGQTNRPCDSSLKYLRDPQSLGFGDRKIKLSRGSRVHLIDAKTSSCPSHTRGFIHAVRRKDKLDMACLDDFGELLVGNPAWQRFSPKLGWKLLARPCHRDSRTNGSPKRQFVPGSIVGRKPQSTSCGQFGLTKAPIETGRRPGSAPEKLMPPTRTTPR